MGKCGRPKKVEIIHGKNEGNGIVSNVLNESRQPKKEISRDLDKTIIKLTAIKAIRAKCLDCCAGQAAEVRECLCNDCPLYGFRMGKNPNYKGRKGNPETLKRFREKSKDFGEEL